ncbi:hypothetical protein KL86SPO_70164 [uncultured Sporomusa sp.]|uniref:Uncharacterized protein n=1 Tax=uncultured Sporomusa sp. TaxID=307249 RepID=A0A212M0L5_9FIRM|nr:hypothetical protein [uncultured Sporomusa sp.]SCM83306.1 hypothetical protein KL86SPO_70164 [uncultured Sporomusa sp.]
MEELLQKMLEKMTTMQTSMASMQQELTAVKQSQVKLDSMQEDSKQSQVKLDSIQEEITEIKQSQTRMENDLGKKVGLLHDGWQSHMKNSNIYLASLIR